MNKTPITYSTNREIGDVSPSNYLEKLRKRGGSIQLLLMNIWNHIGWMWIVVEVIILINIRNKKYALDNMSKIRENEIK